MADITASVVAWSATEASNAPTGDATIGAGLDDNLRALQAGVAKEYLQGSDLTASSTVNAGASGTYGFYEVTATGTPTISSLGTANAGLKRVLRFKQPVTLTYNATSMILPGSANYSVIAGDVGEFISLGSGNWICSGFVPRGASWTNSGISAFNTVADTPSITLHNKTSTSTSASRLKFVHSYSDTQTADQDLLGEIEVYGTDTGNVNRRAGRLYWKQNAAAGSGYTVGKAILSLSNSSGTDTTVWTATDTAFNSALALQENSTRVFSRNSMFQSSETTYGATSEVYTFAHSLAGTPTMAFAYARCSDAGGDNGYSQNDVIGIGSLSSALQSVTVSANSTNVYVAIASAIPATNRTSPATYANLTASKWKVFVRAWY